MRKALLYLLVAILGAWGALAILRVIELLITGGLSAYGAGQLAGTVLAGVILLYGASKALSKARAS